MLASLLTWTSILLEVATLAALAHRRRLRRLLALPLLLVLVLATTVAPLLWPAARTWGVWLAREFAHAFVLLLMGLEIALRIGLRLPSARREARRWIVLLLLALGTVLVVAHGAPPMTGLLPLVMIGVASLYVSLTLIARHHLIPVEPLHKTVLHGFTAYLLVYALGWTLTGDDTTVVARLNAVAFNLLMLALLWAAWRDDTPQGVPESTLLYFWPWRRFERPPERRPHEDDAPRRAAPPLVAAAAER